MLAAEACQSATVGQLGTLENRFTGVFEQVAEWWISHAEELPGCKALWLEFSQRRPQGWC